MAIDEAILNMVERGNATPTLRLYAWEPACLSIGRAQSPDDIDREYLEKNGWDAVRRLTGGRAILHTDELTYAIIAPPSDPRVSGSIPESYEKLAVGLLRGLQLLGLNVEMAISNNTENDTHTNPICFHIPSDQEIVFDGKKLIGSAQARRKNGVLQHGTLPLCGDLSRITHVLRYGKEEERIAAGDGLLENATTAETARGNTVTWDEAAHAMEKGFSEELNISFASGELSDEEDFLATKLEKKKYSNEEWLERN